MEEEIIFLFVTCKNKGSRSIFERGSFPRMMAGNSLFECEERDMLHGNFKGDDPKGRHRFIR